MEIYKKNPIIYFLLAIWDTIKFVSLVLVTAIFMSLVGIFLGALYIRNFFANRVKNIRKTNE